MERLLILCPLKSELDAFLANMHSGGYSSNISQLGSLPVYEFPKLGWRISRAGHGKTQFGIQTQFLLSQLQGVEGVLCVGCAGGLSDGVKIFDVVVAETTVEHDYHERFDKQPQP
jgi:adenosylhomocysteine nucleosidase